MNLPSFQIPENPIFGCTRSVPKHNNIFSRNLFIYFPREWPTKNLRLAEAISKFLPETETRLVETSESPLPATKKPKLETQNCLETENEELKNSVDYLKTKVECLTKENNELKLNYRRISDQNRRLTKEFQTFTNNVNEVKATNTGNGNSLISVKLEEEDTRIKNEIEMIDCEDIKGVVFLKKTR